MTRFRRSQQDIREQIACDILAGKKTEINFFEAVDLGCLAIIDPYPWPPLHVTIEKLEGIATELCPFPIEQLFVDNFNNVPFPWLVSQSGSQGSLREQNIRTISYSVDSHLIESYPKEFEEELDRFFEKWFENGERLLKIARDKNEK